MLRILAGEETYLEKELEKIVEIPDKFYLGQNYPNPFNPITNIVFGLPRESSITIDIYNILGQKVRQLIREENWAAGIHKMEWNGKNDHGVHLPSGIYLIKFTADHAIFLRKAVLTR